MKLMGAFLSAGGGPATVVYCSENDPNEQYSRHLEDLSAKEIKEIQDTMTPLQWYTLTNELPSFLDLSKNLARELRALSMDAFQSIASKEDGLPRVLQGALAANVELSERILFHLLVLTAEGANQTGQEGDASL